MHRIVLSLAAVIALTGCASAPKAVVSAQSSTSVPRVVVADPSLRSLQPGATYVASFPEADRRAACERLEYLEGTVEFAKCMEGYFPDNPYLQANS